MARIPTRQAVFFELEGVLIDLHGPRDTAPLLLPRTVEALQRFDRKRFDLIVATNQPDIAFGRIRERDFHTLTENLLHALEQHDVILTKIYSCPFHPRGRGRWKKESVFRKPNIGMFKMAQQELDLNLARCWVVGHTSVDVLAGSRAGMGTVLVKTGSGGQDGSFDIEPHFTEDDVLAAAKRIAKFEHALMV
jgi:D-glycero-D-manno-heptose 1,7-bisphosphate phosphatase